MLESFLWLFITKCIGKSIVHNEEEQNDILNQH